MQSIVDSISPGIDQEIRQVVTGFIRSNPVAGAYFLALDKAELQTLAQQLLMTRRVSVLEVLSEGALVAIATGDVEIEDLIPETLPCTGPAKAAESSAKEN
jgi:hypothetical protein